jgi:SNF2 family DNA or RNA helicase
MLVHHDRERNVLVYDTPEAARIAAMVPGAVHLYGTHVGVPLSLYNLQLMRWLGHQVPMPLLETGYEWPRPRHIKQPFEAQIVTSNFLTLNPRAFVLSDMGTGKTMSAVWAMDYVMRAHAPGTFRWLIVAPLSTLQRVWGDAIFSSLMGRRSYCIVHGPAAKREALLAQPHDFYIINFDGIGIGASEQKRRLILNGLSKQIAERQDIRGVLVDEASAYKDASTKRHKIARAVIAPKPYFWAMTGTPTPNGPEDAYGLAKLVNDAHGETFTSYKNRVLYKISMFKWLPRAGSHEEARKLLQPAVRFAIEDCVDLPPNTTQQREVSFTPKQTEVYKAMKKDLTVWLEGGGKVTAANEAVLRQKLIQISCGAVYGPDREISYVDAKPRIDELKAVLEQSTHKTIVFAPLTSVLHLLMKELKDYSPALVNGEVSQKERSEIFRAFQQDETPRVLVADPGTMAHGLDLFAATTIVWYAPTDKTEIYLQANKRIDRPGQLHPTTIVQLAATATEREIFKRLENNEKLQGVMLSMVRGNFQYERAA